MKFENFCKSKKEENMIGSKKKEGRPEFILPP